MTIYELKPRFQRLLYPIAGGLNRLHVTANNITVATLLASLVYGGLMLAFPGGWLFRLLPLFMLMRMALNALDGILAIQFQQRSTLGMFLNEIGDVISDAALYAPFLIAPGVSGPVLLLLIFLSLLSEFVGVLAQASGKQRRYDGPLGKSDRAFAFALLGVAVSFGGRWQKFLNPALVAMVLLLAWTVWNRTWQGVRSHSK